MPNRAARREQERINKRNKKNQKRPRTTKTVIHEPIIVSKDRGLVAHLDDGNFYLADKHGVPYTETDIDMTMTYQGLNKERVIAKAVGLSTGTNTVGEWVKNFDLIYGVDTNTKQYDDNCMISAGVLYSARVATQNEFGGTLHCEPVAAFHWVWNGHIHIENYTWVEAIKHIQKNEPKDKKIALVVDSQLGDFEAYNKRTMPLADDFYLPENFTLLYASADYKEEWPNRLIRMCDQLATVQLRRFQGEPILKVLKDRPGGRPLVFIAQAEKKETESHGP